MNRFAAFLNGLSLHRRCLRAPLPVCVLLCVLTTAYIVQSERQNALLERLAGRDFAEFNRYFDIFTSLSVNHSTLYDLFIRSPSREDASWRERAKGALSRINLTIHALEQASEALAERGGQSADLGALQGKLISHTQQYQRAIGALVVFSGDTSPVQAAANLADANALYAVVNRTFTELLDRQQAAIREEIAVQTRRSLLSNRIIAVAGVLAVVLLLMLSQALARLLSGSLEAQVDALTKLGDEAGRPVAARGAHIVEKLEQAVGAFRDVLLRLRKSEHALQITNAELSKARDELEARVRERTRELSQANASLRLYEQVVRSTGEAVVITGPDQAIIEINPAHEQISGRTREEVIGKRLYADAPEPSVEATYRELWRRASTEGRWTGEILDRRKNGEAFPAWAMINAVRDARGEIQHYVSVTR